MRRLRAGLVGVYVAATLVACGESRVLEPAEEAELRSSAAPEAAPLIHLTDLLIEATVASSAAAASASQTREWDAEALGGAWRTLSSDTVPHLAAVKRAALADAVRLSLQTPKERRGPIWIGGIATDLEELRLDDWDSVLVRARSSDRFAGVTVTYNIDEEGALPAFRVFVMSPD